MSERLVWLDSSIEIVDLLSEDLRLVHDLCGLDVLCSLWANTPSIHIYVSLKPLDEAKRRYIRQHFNGSNIKSLAVMLGVSERFVYNVIEGKR